MVSSESRHDTAHSEEMGETAHVSPFQRFIALLLIIALWVSPGISYSAPPEQVPLDYFAQNNSTAETEEPGDTPPAAGENTATPEPAPNSETKTPEWEPPNPPPAGAPQGEIAPPDGVPLAAGPSPLPGISIAAGNCVITGEISDSTSLNPLAGAFVDVVGAGRSAETDAKGRFTIGGLPAGTYTLEATKLGYFAESSVITALDGQPAEARFGLRVKPAGESSEETLLEEETVVGEYQGDSQGDFNLDLAAEKPMLTSGIDREEFAKTGVSDAGDAVAKVSGANIVDGKYAVVRGLADRYVTTTFNGAQIASADPSRKAVQLDLFPSSVIQGINVAKTYSPELSGDFGGAAIDIITRSFPDERILQFKFKSEWNSELDDLMYINPERSLGFFGDAGEDMPDVLETTNPDTGGVAFLPTPDTTPEELKDKMTQLHRSRDLLPGEDEAENGYSYRITYGDTFELANGMKLGIMTAFDRSSGDENNVSDINNQNRSYIKDTYERGVELSAFAAVGLEINELNSIDFTYFNKRAVKDEVTQGRRITGGSQNYGNVVNYGANPIVRDTYGADAVYFREFWDIGTVERDLEILQAQGNHEFSEKGIRLDWGITSSTSSENRPHSSHFEYGLLDFSEEALAPFVAQATAGLDQLIKDNATDLGLDPNTATWENSRDYLVGLIGEEGVSGIETNYGLPLVNGALPTQNTIFPIGGLVGQNERTITAFRRIDSTEEEADHQRIDVAFPFYFDNSSEDRLFEIGIGGANLRKTRNVSARVYSLVTGETNGNFSFPDTLNGLGTSLAADPSGISDYFSGDTTNAPYYGYGVGDDGVENIDTVLQQGSLYISGRLQLGDFFIAGGVRQETEKYEIDVASTPLVPYTDENVDALGWEDRDEQEALLPSMIIGTSLFEKSLDFVFAWSETVARPTFWEFLPTTSVDQSTGIVRRGNVELDRTELTNFDLSATFRPNDTTSLRLTAFHKDLTRPLVQVFSGDGIVYQDSINGQPFDASISGLEIEADIRDLGPFELKGNFTYIDAVLNYYFEGGGVVSPVASQLPFQPAMIANATLGYEYEPWNLTAYLVYNFNGEYPTILKSDETQSEVTRLANSTFDFIVAKKFETEHAEIIMRCGLKNLLGEEDTYVYDDRTYFNDAIGRSFYIEAEISF